MNFVADENLKKLFLAKENKGLTFKQLGEAIDKSEVWVSALFHGQAMVSNSVINKTLGLKRRSTKIA